MCMKQYMSVPCADLDIIIIFCATCPQVSLYFFKIKFIYVSSVQLPGWVQCFGPVNII